MKNLNSVSFGLSYTVDVMCVFSRIFLLVKYTIFSPAVKKLLQQDLKAVSRHQIYKLFKSCERTARRHGALHLGNVLRISL